MIWWKGCSSFRLCAPLLKTENYVGKASRLFRKVLQHNLLPLINFRWPGLTRCFLLVDLKQIHVNPYFAGLSWDPFFIFGRKTTKKPHHFGGRFWANASRPFFAEADAFWQTHPFRRNADKMHTQLAAPQLEMKFIIVHPPTSGIIVMDNHGYMPSGKHTESDFEHGIRWKVSQSVRWFDILIWWLSLVGSVSVSLPEGR